MKLWLLKRAAEAAGQELELRRRPVEAPKWRYVWDEQKTEPGHVVLKEQNNYIYNAEYDSEICGYMLHEENGKWISEKLIWNTEMHTMKLPGMD